MRKKFTLLLTALFFTIGTAWAQVPEASPAPQNGQWDANTKWYTLQVSDKYVSLHNADGNGNLMLNNATSRESAQSLWCVVGSEAEGYQFYNLASGTSKVLGATGSNENGRMTMYDAAGGVNDVTYRFDVKAHSDNKAYVKDHGTDSKYWNNRDSYLAYWNTNSAVGNSGSACIFTEINLADFVAQYKQNALSALDGLSSLFDVAAAKNAVNAITATDVSALAAIDAAIDAEMAKVASHIAFRNADNNTQNTVRVNNYLSVNVTNGKGYGTPTFNHLNAVWTLKYSGGFCLYNEGNEVYLGTPSSNGTLSKTPTAAYSIDKEEEKVVLKSNGETIHLNNHSGNFLSNHDNNDIASRWYLETDFSAHVETYKQSALTSLDEWAQLTVVFDDAELIAEAKTAIYAITTTDYATFDAIDAELAKVTDAVAAKMFTFQTIDISDAARVNVWIAANASTMKAYGADKDKQDYNAIWSLQHAGGTQFYLYNELNKVYLGAPVDANTAIVLTETPVAAYTLEMIIDKGNNVVEMHCNGGTIHASNHGDDKLISYDENQDASRWMVNVIDVTKDIKDLLATIEEDDYDDVPGLGQYTTAGYEALVEAGKTAKTVEEVEAAIAAFKAAKNLPVFMISNGNVKDYAKDKSIIDDNDGTLNFEATDLWNKKMWWALDMTETEVKVTDEVGIYNVGTGNGFWGASSIKITETNENSNAGIPDDGLFLFYTTGNNTPIHFQSNFSEIVRYGSYEATSGSAAMFTYIGNSYDLNQLTDDNEFTITEGENYTYAIQHPVKKLNYTRTFSNCNWQSLYVPFNIPVSKLTESFDVARIQSIEGGEELSNVVMTIEKITEGELTANTAYFIRAKGQDDLNLELTNTIIYPAVVNSTEYTIDNFKFVITGTYEQISLNEGQYALSGGQWKAPANTEVKLNPFRVYCTVTNNGAALTPEAAAAMAIRISTRGESDEETTNIESISKNQDADVIYDLLGRRVLNTSKGGIYIINNKKVVIK